MTADELSGAPLMAALSFWPQVRELSFDAVKHAMATLRTVESRSQRAQEESHTRIMMYQLVADECGEPSVAFHGLPPTFHDLPPARRRRVRRGAHHGVHHARRRGDRV